MALDLLLNHVVNVRWGGGDTQGLVAEWPGFSSIDGGLIIGTPGDPIAYAIDSGHSFPGVNMGASGLGKTVFTKGLICFGKPKGGEACFIACPDFVYYDDGSTTMPLKRGTIDPESGELIWSDVGSSTTGLIALTFAGDAFFATYKDPSSRIEVSYNGRTWSSASAFPAPEEDTDCVGGVVASLGASDDSRYVSVGAVSQEDEDDYFGFTSNLAWATSTDGGGWSFGFNAGMMQEPGAMTGLAFIGSNQACTVCAGKGVFVAATCKKTEVVTMTIPGSGGDPDIEMKNVYHTATVATSYDGTTWSTGDILPGATPGGNDGHTISESQTTAVIFAKSKDSKGYFLAASTESVGPAISAHLWKSDNGFSWAQIKSGNGYFYAMSVIAKDLSSTSTSFI